MPQQVMKNVEEKMQKAIAAFKKELATIRAGRANPAILDRVQVEYYGMPTPINQLANVSVPEARLLLIQPFDKSSLGEIEKAIQKAELGLAPNNDGNVIRLSIPALTEERRKELTKIVKKYAEDSRVAIRNIRRDGNDELKKMQKDSEITEDDLKYYTDEVQKLTDKYIAQVDSIAETKEEEIMEV